MGKKTDQKVADKMPTRLESAMEDMLSKHSNSLADVSVELETQSLQCMNYDDRDPHSGLMIDDGGSDAFVKVDSKIDEKIVELIRTEQEQTYSEARKAKMSADSIFNMQRHYEEAQNKIIKFGKKVIRSVAAEYIIRHNPEVGEMFLVDYSNWTPEKRFVLFNNRVEYNDWAFFDDHYVVFQPCKAEGPFAEEPKPVVFNIPYNFLPSLFNWAKTKEEIKKESSIEGNNSWFNTRRLDTAISVNIGQIEIDIETLFKNFYIARTAGTGALRVPFIIRRNADACIHFTVRVEMEKAKYFSNAQDLLLDDIIRLSRKSAKQVIEDVNEVMDKIVSIEAAERNLNKALSAL